MAIKGGQILNVGNGVTVIDRIQNSGPNQVNVPTEKINEVGNYKSVGIILDTPNLTFGYDSYDMSTETEALVTGGYAGRTVADGVIASGTLNTLTSATAAFSSVDVGRMVIVAGAGASGGELVSTITTVTNATTVVLADAATGAVSAASVTIIENGFDFAKSVPIDIASQFKPGKNTPAPYSVVSSVAVPFLSLSAMSYKVGMHDNASQSGTLNGDSIYYNPGAAFVESALGTGAANQTIVTAHPAYQTVDGDPRRVLAVAVGLKRLVFGVDYTESYGTVANGAAITTLTLVAAVATTDSIRIVYSSPDAVTYDQSVHQGLSVKPAAIRGRDIEIYVGGYNPNDRAGSAANKLSGLQSAQVDWKVNLTADEQLGSYFAVSQDADIPETSGSLDFKPIDPADFVARVRKLAGVSDATAVLGASTSVPLPLDVVIKNPDTKGVIKRLHIDDARFTVPGFQSQVQQQMTVSLPWASDDGALLVFAR